MTTLRRQARAARQAYWLPLCSSGCSSRRPRRCTSSRRNQPRCAPGPAPCPERSRRRLPGESTALGWYWLAALVGGYLAGLTWYRWHGRRAGVQTPTRAYVIAGLAGTLVGLALPVALEFLLFNTSGPVWAAPVG
ncbi:hypothetical protein V2I01_14920 [Micromonospora sp. BRA006-A]|nr:hypothetical protein [Micromonospora sp. BRA006-A]